MPHAKPNQGHGFTLVELSIVLVILGLLAGGVLSGQSLIRAAQLRSITTDLQRYSAAMNSFRDKYFATTGDMPNATAFWGVSGSTGCINRTASTVTTPGTCDGDGDSLIEYGLAGQSAEAFQAWRQLALAGLIEGSYSGITGTAGNFDHDYGINSPTSRISSVGWSMTYFDNTAAAAGNVYNENYINWFTIGISDNIFAENPFLKPEEAWNIDTKLDDGMPGKGAVHTWPQCSTITTSTNREGLYLLSSNEILCPLLFKQ